tara:strand:- start:3024 stop:3869 length:846 start_codon:yes stop_codon:yes gene_type:complete
MNVEKENIYTFQKMNGAGNTFLLHDSRVCKLDINKNLILNLRSFVQNYKFDQFICIENPIGNGDCLVKFWNADGTESGMCGNALRCVGNIILKETKKDKIVIETINKDIECWRSVDKISVNIGEPLFGWSEIPLVNPVEDTLSISLEPCAFDLPNFSAVNVGNPHAIFFFDDNKPEIGKIGETIENHEMFADKVNVSFANLINENHIFIDVWERGTGVTKACGSAACATTVAAACLNITSRNTKVSFEGGDLNISWKNDNNIVMTGPYEIEEKLEINISDF